MPLFRKILCFSAFFLLFFSCAALASDENTYLSGIVVDQENHPIQGATVTLQKHGKNSKEHPGEYQTITDEKGKFVFQKIEEGDYQVICQKEGYHTQIKEEVPIKKGTPLGISFLLAFGSSGNPSGLISFGPVNPKTSIIYLAVSSPSTSQKLNPSSSLSTDDSPYHDPYTELSDLGAIPYGGNPLEEGVPSFTSNQRANLLPSVHSNNLSILDTTTQKTVAIIPTASPAYWIQFSPDGSRLWAIDSTHTLSLYSPDGNLLSSVNLGDYLVSDMAMTTRGDTLYLAAKSWPSPAIFVVDGKTNAIQRTIALPENQGQPGGIAVTPDGEILLVTMGTPSSGQLFLLDAKTGSVKNKIQVGNQPLGVGVTSNSRIAIVANYNSASVDVVNLGKGTVQEVHTGIQPSRVCIRRDNQIAFVTNQGEDTVTAINLETALPSASIPVGQGPIALASTPDGDKIYVANHESANVTVIEASTFAVLGTTAPSPNLKVFGIAIKPYREEILPTNPSPEKTPKI